VTLNDLELNGVIAFALFHRIRAQCLLKTIIRPTSVSKSTFDSLWPYWYDAQSFNDYLGKTNCDNSVS